ncbi:hypothetical protein ACQPZF_26595 [Actinosynnema sp. CS-041913]|uniref:hypothetical protein n=1 Tax=Actinosynnema sp. CS-041913 TaxID=3239917 RepID=UPI003D8DAC0A
MFKADGRRPDLSTRPVGSPDTWVSSGHLIRKPMSISDAASPGQSTPTPRAMAECDLICGLSGLGAYHLHHNPQHEITDEVLSYLVRLTEPLPGSTDDLPGWWTDVGTRSTSPRGMPSAAPTA